MEAEAEVAYCGEYQQEGSDTWYAAGDIYGYPTIEEAQRAVALEVVKHSNAGYERVTAGRVYGRMWTTFPVMDVSV